jgi:serine/threonine-protein kinase
MEEVRPSLKPGDEIAAKYRVDRVLGRGGMGVVLAATHLVTRQRVALKLLLPDGAGSPDAVQRFMNEARASVQIQSEHVVRVTDVDRLPSGEPYMVMEYLEGQDLAALVQTRGPLPVEEALDYVLQACEALAEAHALGIVHRDLKPANLFLTHRRDGSALVKVLDFGISRLNDGFGPRLTQTRGTMGSPLYMSPEQLVTPKDIDRRSDLWALGIVLFELLSGEWPFEAETVEGLVVEIATKPPVALRRLRDDLPRAIEHVIGRCLEKRRDDRFQSVAELANALAPLVGQGSQLSIDRINRILGSLPSPTVSSNVLTIDPLAMPAPLSPQPNPPSPEISQDALGGTAVIGPTATVSTLCADVPSIDPTARHLGEPRGVARVRGSASARWPLVVGGVVLVGATAILVHARSTASPLAGTAPSATAAAGPIVSAAPASTEDAAAPPSTSSSTPPSASANATPASRPATKGARVSVVGAVSPSSAVAAPSAVAVAAPPAAPPPPAAKPPDFGGK